MHRVRYATQDDMPRIVELARREHALSKWADVPFNPHILEATFNAFRMQMGKTALVTDGGYLGGMLTPLPFSNQMLAVEYAWYAEDGSGMALAAKFDHWARNMGAVGVVMHNYTNNERLARVLERRLGFEPMGGAYHKSIKE